VKIHSRNFGKKEKVLNYANQTYQLSRPNKVGTVMALIRECQPKTIEEWEKWYFEKAHTKGKNPAKITKDTLVELGERLYIKITEIVIRTFDGFYREKSVVTGTLEKKFLDVRFVESEPELDHAGDVDYLGYVGNKAFGIQIKPVTAKANFGNYSPSERMRASFREFELKYGGKVFITFSVDDEVKNIEVLEEIEKEIFRLKKLQEGGKD